ncbi:type II toxin-antitoxin system VapB family antitoxin [Oryzibacter oryziterrae]|uniref:type II toxin-antitoxin system VapB family antitoxin n=1 Tax=Oryzibacter oryziterrae TaxID=2766474 RepID=UPI001F1EF57D|nr:type II toxin-antitoxin system VapB family antitoxin [Oryzibacter oryziterrae]
MQLHLQDDEALALAEEVKRLTHADSLEVAVKQALRHEIDRVKNSTGLWNRLSAAREKAGQIGPGNPDFDMKSFTDAMWGDK